jgi:hypothetical protein
MPMWLNSPVGRSSPSDIGFALAGPKFFVDGVSRGESSLGREVVHWIGQEATKQAAPLCGWMAVPAASFHVSTCTHAFCSLVQAVTTPPVHISCFRPPCPVSASAWQQAWRRAGFDRRLLALSRGRWLLARRTGAALIGCSKVLRGVVCPWGFRCKFYSMWHARQRQS